MSTFIFFSLHNRLRTAGSPRGWVAARGCVCGCAALGCGSAPAQSQPPPALPLAAFAAARSVGRPLFPPRGRELYIVGLAASGSPGVPAPGFAFRAPVRFLPACACGRIPCRRGRSPPASALLPASVARRLRGSGRLGFRLRRFASARSRRRRRPRPFAAPAASSGVASAAVSRRFRPRPRLALHPSSLRPPGLGSPVAPFPAPDFALSLRSFAGWGGAASLRLPPRVPPPGGGAKAAAAAAAFCRAARAPGRGRRTRGRTRKGGSHFRDCRLMFIA